MACTHTPPWARIGRGVRDTRNSSARLRRSVVTTADTMNLLDLLSGVATKQAPLKQNPPKHRSVIVYFYERIRAFSLAYASFKSPSQIVCIDFFTEEQHAIQDLCWYYDTNMDREQIIKQVLNQENMQILCAVHYLDEKQLHDRMDLVFKSLTDGSFTIGPPQKAKRQRTKTQRFGHDEKWTNHTKKAARRTYPLLATPVSLQNARPR